MAARIGLTQRVEEVPARAERRDALDQRWAALLAGAGHVPIPIPNLVPDVVAHLEALDVDLLVLTGGNDLAGLPGATAVAPERDALEQLALDHAQRCGLPVLGVCRGLQSMVHHGGGRLERVQGHVGAVHAVQVVADSPWPLVPAREVNSFHDWGVAPSGTGTLVPLAVDDDGFVEAVMHPSLPQVGIMWHPERSPSDGADLALIESLIGARP